MLPQLRVKPSSILTTLRLRHVRQPLQQSLSLSLLLLHFLKIVMALFILEFRQQAMILDQQLLLLNSPPSLLIS